MHLANSFWNELVRWASLLTLSPWDYSAQQPIPGRFHGHSLDSGVHEQAPVIPQTPFTYAENDRLIWNVSGSFQCNYTRMKDEGWERCNSPSDRGCWLRNRFNNSIQPWSVNTNYEEYAPKGILREYEFDVTDGTWNTDGYPSENMQLINKRYPGPWVQACWGDTIRVKINNKLKHNGTAMHWHGIRQHNSMHMDGVPGITQCPIAPKDYFVYEFNTTQYGDSWYHSHYSVQYANGMLGPLTIYGPTTAPYDDDPIDFSPPRLGTPDKNVVPEDNQQPLLMSDWFHQSSFGVIHEQLPGYGTILLNGRGNITNFRCKANAECKQPYPNATLRVPPMYELHFQPRTSNPLSTPKRYLLRLINTSFSTTFIFSIDHHTLQIVSADFVPMIPSEPRTHVLVGIGQRYNIIVTADPVSYPDGTKPPSDGKFWIRTTVAKCFREIFRGVEEYDQTGMLLYQYQDSPTASRPSTKPWPNIADIIDHCEDERTLTPKLPWYVPRPKNSKGNDTQDWGELFSVSRTGKHPIQATYPLAHWDFRSINQTKNPSDVFNPLQINYSNVTFLNLDNIDQKHFEWPKVWVIVPEDYSDNDWVYLALTGPEGKAFGAHPIHLHGHDFAEIASAYNVSLPENPKDINFKVDNPIRRDVVLLPTGGYVVIAFKTDNPGSWIMHCHIAFHASEGLALQILERQKDANARWPQSPIEDKSIAEAQRVCNNWDVWHSNCTNWWPGKNDTLLGMDGKPGCWPSCSKNKPQQKKYACMKEMEDHIFMDDSGI